MGRRFSDQWYTATTLVINGQVQELRTQSLSFIAILHKKLTIKKKPEEERLLATVCTPGGMKAGQVLKG
jgi:hypothetical protein